MRSQHRDAGCERPTMFAGPWRTRRAPRAGDEFLDFLRRHIQLLSGPSHFLTTPAQLHIQLEVPRCAAHRQLIHHAVGAARQTMRLADRRNRCGKIRKRRLTDDEGDDGVAGRQFGNKPL